jgi:hypothetical protein
VDYNTRHAGSEVECNMILLILRLLFVFLPLLTSSSTLKDPSLA